MQSALDFLNLFVLHAQQLWLDALALAKPWHAHMPQAVWLGAALWLAVVLADRVQRVGGQRTTAYWWCGAALAIAAFFAGYPLLVAMPGSLEQELPLQWLFDVALGWVVFTLGQRIDVRWLLRNKALSLTAVLEFAFTAVAMTYLLIALGIPWLAASAAGILAAHSSPVVLASLMHEWQPDGQVSARALHVGGLNTLLAALSLPMLLAWGEAWQQGAVQSTALGSGQVLRSLPIFQRSGWELAQPLVLLLLSLGVGAILGRLLARSQGKTSQRACSSFVIGSGAASGRLGLSSDSLVWVAAVCMCAGLAQWWGAPAWAACLSLGLNLRTHRSGARANAGLEPGVQTGLTALAQLLLFGLSAVALLGLLLRALSGVPQVEMALGLMIPLVAVLLLVRLCGKLLVCTLTARWAGLRWHQGFALGLMLQPLSMTGLALLLLAWPVILEADVQLACSLALAIMLSDWLAPMALRRLLIRCGDMLPDEPLEGLHSRSSTEPTHIDTSSLPPAMSPPAMPASSPNPQPARVAVPSAQAMPA